MKVTHQSNSRKLSVPFTFQKDSWSELDKKLINIIDESRNLRLYKNSTFIDFEAGHFFVSKMVVGHDSLFDDFIIRDDVAKNVLSFDLIKLPSNEENWKLEVEALKKMANASGYSVVENSSLEIQYHVDQFNEFSLKYILHISL